MNPDCKSLSTDDLPPFINLQNIANLLGIHRQTAKRTTQQPGFPQPVKIGNRNHWPTAKFLELFPVVQR